MFLPHDTIFPSDSVTLVSRPVTSLGHQEGRKVFCGAQIFLTMANSFQLCPTHLSRGGKKFSREGFAPPGYGPASKSYCLVKNFLVNRNYQKLQHMWLEDSELTAKVGPMPAAYPAYSTKAFAKYCELKRHNW